MWVSASDFEVLTQRVLRLENQTSLCCEGEECMSSLLQRHGLIHCMARFEQLGISLMDELRMIVDAGEWPRVSQGVPLVEAIVVLKLLRRFRQSPIRHHEPRCPENNHCGDSHRDTIRCDKINVSSLKAAMDSYAATKLHGAKYSHCLVVLEAMCTCPTQESSARGTIVEQYEATTAALIEGARVAAKEHTSIIARSGGFLQQKKHTQVTYV